jgi:hypothetical protein
MALTLRAIGFADVRFGFQPPQSGSPLRGVRNDGELLLSQGQQAANDKRSSFRGCAQRRTRTAKAGCRSEHSRSEWPEGRAADAASNPVLAVRRSIARLFKNARKIRDR